MNLTDLFIVRHGIAEDRNPDDPSDHARQLTDIGSRRVSKAARGMRRLDVAPDAIWTSPHIRALQTATILSGELTPPGGMTTRECLSFRGGSAEIRTELASAPSRLMLVGHEPILSDLVSELCASGRLRIQLRKCSMVHIAVRQGPRGPTGELVAYLTPRVLRTAAPGGSATESSD